MTITSPPEIIIENFSKKKRGRPLTFIGEFAKISKDIYSDVLRSHTYRTFENELYQHRAITAICDVHKGFEEYQKAAEPYGWLLGTGRGMKGAKKTILTELGRLHLITNNDEDLKNIAEELCKTKPRTQDIIPVIRAVRLNYEREKKKGGLK